MSMVLALALAQATPVGDPRLISVVWRDNAVLRLTGRTGVETTITLGPDEHIENVAIGDANAWQVTPNRRANMLFLKPMLTHARTNLTIVTDRHTYFFDLVAAPRARAIYGLRLTYPADPPKPPPPPVALSSEETALAHGASPVDPASLDLGFTMHGARELLPARVFGDGHATYLSWPKDVAVPAILLRNDRGVEGPVNFAVQGDMIVIDGTPDTIVLRNHKLVATIDHAHPANQGAKP